MIVLGRKLGERIHIGKDVIITVVKTGKQIRLGIEAPKELVVIRGELYDQPWRKNADDAKSN